MTIAEFKKIMTDAFIGNETVRETYGLSDGLTFESQFSAVSLENIIFSVVSTAMWIMQQLFDRFKEDVSQVLNEQMPGNAAWYAHKARMFQFGMDLVEGTDHYDNSGLTGEQIEAMRVAKYAAAIEARDKSILYVKVATNGGNGVRQPLSSEQLTAFQQYLRDVQYAGVRISVINDPADEMKLQIDVYYDPLVLNETGKRLDETSNAPVQDAIGNYLANLPFNGTYTSQGLVDALQAVEGVHIAEIKSASSRYGAYAEFTEINAREIAHAGYYQISDANLKLNFIADEEVL
ncbi:MAG: hypothetical protein LBU37_00390 [Tannerellaceae bacterium]|jgi:hypothetical protein|nr:hypothetical protein [Tannerellaceae bacterium]